MTEQKSDAMEPTPVESVNTSRRKLTAAALAGPVVLGTLVSKQALGQVAYKCTVSGQVSGTPSPRPGDTDNCGILGLSPGCWKQCITVWPSPYTDSRSATFNTTFAVNVFGTLSLIQLLSPEDYANSGANTYRDTPFARIAIASLLNAIQFTYPDNFPVNKNDVIAMVQAYFSGGSFTLTSGQTASWSKDQISDYLASLYGGSSTVPDEVNQVGCPNTGHVKQPNLLAGDTCPQAISTNSLKVRGKSGK